MEESVSVVWNVKCDKDSPTCLVADPPTCDVERASERVSKSSKSIVSPLSGTDANQPTCRGGICQDDMSRQDRGNDNERNHVEGSADIRLNPNVVEPRVEADDESGWQAAFDHDPLRLVDTRHLALSCTPEQAEKLKNPCKKTTLLCALTR